MSNKIKLLLLVILAISLIAVFAACDKTPSDENGNIDENNNTPNEIVNDALTTENMVELNIYYHGLKTSVAVDSDDAEALVSTLGGSLRGWDIAAVADTNGMAASDMTAAETCMELVYSEEITLPLSINEERVSGQKILYVVDTSTNIGTLYCGGQTYANALVSAADGGFAGIIAQYIAENIEKAVFEGDDVLIAGMTIPYLSEYSDKFAEPLLSQIIYNTVAFYQNCYYKNFAGNKHLATAELVAAVNYAVTNSTNSNAHGEQYITQLNNFFDIQVPLSVQVVNDGNYGDYIVNLVVDEITTLEIVFKDVDGYPLIDILRVTAV